MEEVLEERSRDLLLLRVFRQVQSTDLNEWTVRSAQHRRLRNKRSRAAQMVALVTVPSRTNRPVAVVTGRAVAAVRAVFKTDSMLFPLCIDCVFSRTIPVIGRPAFVIGRIAGLGPPIPPLAFAVGCRIDVPGMGA